MAGSVVGTAYVRLRLLTDSIGKDIESAVKKQDFQDLDIHVNADTEKANAELEKTGLEADKLGAKSPTITPKVDTKDAKKETSLLRDALVLLGPTIGPLGGAAAAAFGGVAAGAGVAVLAVLGVKKEMLDATKTGVAFQTGIQQLKGDLSTLEVTAAKSVLPGFQSTVGTLNSILPGVNRSVGILGRELGDISAHVVVGLVAGLQTFEPLLTHVGQSADIAARHFQDWATGAGGAHFAQTLGQNFDQVVPVLADLVQTVGKLVAAFAPIGSQVVGVIGALGALADAINAIPLPVLKGLADIFVTLYGANRLAGIFGNLSVSLAKMGAESDAASTGMGSLATKLSGFARLAGGAAAVGFSIYSIGKSISNFTESGNSAVKALDNIGSANTSFYNALIQSKGALDDTAASSIQYQLTQDGLIGKAAKAGISQDQLTQAVAGTDEQTQALIDTWKKSGSPSHNTLFALASLHKSYVDAAAAAKAYTAELDRQAASPAWGALKTNQASVTQVADKFGIAADSVKTYASLLGISKTAIKNGDVTNQQLASAVKTVSDSYNTATAAGSVFLDALAKFSTSSGTAADRAQLIGATLKAANGDALGFAQAMNSVYSANANLTTSLKTAASQVGKNGESIGSYVKSIVNLKTGTIDYTNTAAGPLIQGLQQIQDAAMAAAQAQYQHEVATKGGKAAADDAYKTYVSQTRGSLIDEATQLGLTHAQATKLADAYFGMPKDVKTKIEQEGADPVVTVLKSINQILEAIAKSWGITVNADTHKATSNISVVNDAIHGLHGKTVEVGADTHAAQHALDALNAQINSMHPVIQVTAHTSIAGGGGRNVLAATGGLIYNGQVQRRADGGPAGLVKGPGSGTADKAGLFALSNGEYVSTAASTARNYPALQAGNRGATLVPVWGMASGGTVKQPVLRLPGPTSRQLTMQQSTVPRAKFRGDPSVHAHMNDYLASVVTSIGHLAVAYSDRPVILVAKDGTALAKVVNDANLANARRMG